MNIKFASRSEIDEIYCKQLHNQSAKLGLTLLDLELDYYNNFCKMTKHPLKLKNVKMFSTMMSLGCLRNSIFSDLLGKIGDRVVESGIPKFLDDFGTLLTTGVTEQDDIDNRRVLSLRDLEYGFVLWLVACAISILAFCVELLRWKRYLGGKFNANFESFNIKNKLERRRKRAEPFRAKDSLQENVLIDLLNENKENLN